MSLSVTQFESVCRTCLKRSVGRTSIFANFDPLNILSIDNDTGFCNVSSCFTDKLRISEVLLLCSPKATITENEYCPKAICFECLQKLRNFYDFRQLIERSDKVLREFFKLKFVSTETAKLSDAVTHEILNPIEYFKCEEVEKNTPSEELCFVDPKASQQDDVTDSQSTTSNKNVRAPLDEFKISNEKSESKYRCIVCSKLFRGRVLLGLHLMKKHYVRNNQSVFRPHQCDRCEKAYTSPANLNIHKLSHSANKPFKCNQCDRAFYKENSLLNHTAIHTGLRRYQCDQCERSFTSSNILQQHKKTHSDVRAHKCEICPRAFHKLNDLRNHLRTHTGERPYLCSHCGRGFTRKSQLNVHFRIHTGEKPYQCETCQKSFAQSGDLTAHIRIHSGERPYQCKLCEKKFNQTSGLHAHMRAHLGERKYVCCVCNRSFTQASSLGRHMKNHCKSEFEQPTIS